MTLVHMYIDDRPTTDLASWKFRMGIGPISAAGHPIHFVFGSRVEVSEKIMRE